MKTNIFCRKMNETKKNTRVFLGVHDEYCIGTIPDSRFQALHELIASGVL